MTFVKGQSGNPKGRKKGASCQRAKEDYFKVYQELGGKGGVKKHFKQNPKLLDEFYLKVLPGLMPKKQDVDGNLSGTISIRIKGRNDGNGNTNNPA